MTARICFASTYCFLYAKFLTVRVLEDNDQSQALGHGKLSVGYVGDKEPWQRSKQQSENLADQVRFKSSSVESEEA